MKALRICAVAMVIAAGMISSAYAGNFAVLSGGAGCPLFTGGLQQIAAQLKARGFTVSVGCNFNKAEILQHRRDHGVLIGHSFGAKHAGEVAGELLAAGMRVDVIAIEPLYTAAVCPRGVKCICYYGQGFPMPGAQNVHIPSAYGHIGYAADPRIQARVIAAAER